jgi:uncharacterized BrkB/YihY/UPF0761 family membrane protein
VERLDGVRPRHASVDVGFRWFWHDREIAGGVLGGGLAYRLFFWTLALTVLLCGVLGESAKEGENVNADGKEVGLPGAFAHSVASAAQQSKSERWWLLAIGAYLTLWFSWSLLRSLRLVHAAAWRTEVRPLRNVPRALGFVVVAPLMLVGMLMAAGWVRAHTGPVEGLIATLAVAALLGAFWLVVSSRLAAEDGVPWTAFLPGAVIIAVGVEALHLITVYYLARQLASASALYGTLGLAGSALFFLYLIGRGVVWAAELNAVVWTVRKERAAPPASRQTSPAS